MLCSYPPISNGSNYSTDKTFPCDWRKVSNSFIIMVLLNVNWQHTKAGVSWSHVGRSVRPRCSSTCGFAFAVHGTEVLLPWVLYREGNMLFLPLCGCDQTPVQSPASERCVGRDFLPGRGLDKGPHSMLGLRDPFDLRLWDMQSLTLSSVSKCGSDVLEMWVLSGFCVFGVARLYRVSGTWAFNWVTGRSSGWRLFIPSSSAVWPPSKTSWISWST